MTPFLVKMSPSRSQRTRPVIFGDAGYFLSLRYRKFQHDGFAINVILRFLECIGRNAQNLLLVNGLLFSIWQILSKPFCKLQGFSEWRILNYSLPTNSTLRSTKLVRSAPLSMPCERRARSWSCLMSCFCTSGSGLTNILLLIGWLVFTTKL